MMFKKEVSLLLYQGTCEEVREVTVLLAFIYYSRVFFVGRDHHFQKIRAKKVPEALHNIKPIVRQNFP
jgi:hypothetical protein